LLRSPHDGDIARLAVPAIGTLVAEPLYVLADTAIVGRLGTDQLAGLALASTVLLTAHALLIFLAYGATSTVARLMGAGRESDAARQSVQGLWLAVLLGTAAAVTIAVTREPILDLLGGQGQARREALIYLDISLIGLPFMMLVLAGSGAFNGRQDTRTPLLIAVAGAVLNLGLELILIPGLGYGIGASALSTVVAQTLTGTVFVAAVVRWGRSRSVALSLHWPSIRRLMMAGQPLIIRAVALRGSFTLSAAVAARIGVAELAAYQIGIQIWATLALALDAVAIAGQALTGKWLGAGDAARARGAARRMIEIDIAVGAVAGLAVLLFRDELARAFSPDPAVIAATAAVLIWVAVTQPLNGYVFALDGILIGAGDLRYLGRTMAVTAVVFTLLALVLMWTGQGLNRLWAALVVFMMLRAVALWARWRTDRWIVLGA
jgi:putative MATE family efflux protein